MVILGKHMAIRPQSTSSRLALVAVAAGAVSTASVGGAAAATVGGHQEPKAVEYTPVNDSSEIPAGAPQVLSISEFKPVVGLQEQLDKALELASSRKAAAQVDLAEATAEGSSQLSSSGFSLPALGSFTSGFGPRWGTFHAGIDIANAEGTPILAAMDGTVIDSGPASGFGQWIRIQHDDGTVTVYGHMSTLNVSVGERVTAGQVIAGMGSMGFSTGSHLHFEVHPGGGSAVDPIPWLAERGIFVS